MPSGYERASADASASVSHGNIGSDAERIRRLAAVAPVRLCAFTLGRQILHRLRIVLRHADLRRAPGRAEFLEEIGVDLCVMAPLIGDIVLVVDGLDRTD